MSRDDTLDSQERIDEKEIKGREVTKNITYFFQLLIEFLATAPR